MNANKKLILALIVALAVGYVWGDSQPCTCKQERPVATWIARAAKRMLWFVVLADPPPEDVDVEARQIQVDDQGLRVVDHRRGW